MRRFHAGGASLWPGRAPGKP